MLEKVVNFSNDVAFSIGFRYLLYEKTVLEKITRNETQ
jgi:hypothetical protein